MKTNDITRFFSYGQDEVGQSADTTFLSENQLVFGDIRYCFNESEGTGRNFWLGYVVLALSVLTLIIGVTNFLLFRNKIKNGYKEADEFKQGN